MSIKFVRYKYAKETMEPDANGEWVKWDDFQSSRLNIKQMKKDRNDAEKRETLAADTAVRYLDRAEAAEAKLAKAVEALRSCPPTSNPNISPQEKLDRIDAWWRLEVRPVLAELEGKE